MCFIRFADSVSASVAQHLTNTVFIDRAMIVQPYTGSKMPDAGTAMSLTAGVNFTGGSNSGLISQIVAGVGGTQVISTIDPRLSALGLPQYPPLPATTDPVRVEEIRRTIYVGNLDSKLPADSVLEFFNSIGEVKYVRMAGDESQPTRFAFIEFTDQSTVANALQYNGVSFGGRALKINHSNNAIVKQPTLKHLSNSLIHSSHHSTTDSHHNSSGGHHHHSSHSHRSSSGHTEDRHSSSHRSSSKHDPIDEAMRRVREAESQIAMVIEKPTPAETGRRDPDRFADDRKRRDRDRHSRHRSRDRSRDRDRERDRDRDRDKGRERRTSRDRRASSRDRGSSHRSERRRSRSRERESSRKERASPSDSSSHRRKRSRSKDRSHRSERKRVEK